MTRMLALVLLALAAVSCVARPPAIAPIKLGVLVPLSGALESQGPQEKEAAELAAEDVNAGGGVIDGRPLELVIEDSATDPDTAVSKAKDLLKQGVVALIGPATSGESKRVLSEVITPARVPMTSCCATATELTSGNPPNGGFFFRTTPSDKLQGKALAFIADHGLTTADGPVVEPACPAVAFMFRNDAYGAGFSSVFQAEYTGAILETGNYGTPEQEASLADLDGAAVTLADAIGNDLPGTTVQPELCIVVISFDTDGGEVIAKLDEELGNIYSGQAHPLSYHYMVGDGANSAVFATRIGQAAGLGDKIIGTVPFHATTTAYSQFVSAFDARFSVSDEPIAFTAQTYDAVFLTALAITQAGSTSGQDIRNKLYSVSGANGGTRFEGAFFGEVANAVLEGKAVDYVGPSGEATFDAFGDVVGDYVLWQVTNDGNNGAIITNREPILASTFNPQ